MAWRSSGRGTGALVVVALCSAGCGARSDLDRGDLARPDEEHTDAGPDAAADGGARDAIDVGVDGGAPVLEAARARFPWNGWATGSVWAERALRPTFQWEAVPGADSYELRLDDDCTSNESCEFPSPEVFVFETTRVTLERALEVDLVPPVGRRYRWAVRACRTSGSARVCSDFSATRYLDVGRQHADYDGDGYADLVVGAARYPAPTGEETAHFVFRGAPGGIELTDTMLMPAERSYAPANVGDLNGDGFADFALMAGGPPAFGFRALVHYGSPAGLSPAPSLVVEADDPLCAFAASIVGPGDLDGDGFADLAIGTLQPHSCSGTDERGPVVQIFYGREDALVPGPALSLDGPFSSFGRLFMPTLGGVGDVDGDGYPDLLVGLVDFLDHRPALLYRGSKHGIVPDRPTPIEPEVPASERYYFPSRIPSVGDLDGDGYADVVTTRRPPYDVDPPGAVFVHRGSATGPAARPSVTLPNETGARVFGDAITGGDLNGDGLGDVAFTVGTLDEQHVRVHFGAALGVSLEATRLSYAPGRSSALLVLTSPGDFDGDGAMDLTLGAPYGDGLGVVSVWPGSLDGPGALIDLPTPAGRAFGALIPHSTF